MRVIWQSEIDPYASAVLRKHWPDVPNHGDIRGIDARVSRPDVLCGGFPCQPVSSAGSRLGREDDRWLWSEYRRVIQQLRPDWVIGENVAGLLEMGLDDILADLEGDSYAARTFDIPARAVGARHERRRLWIVAHAAGSNDWKSIGEASTGQESEPRGRPLEGWRIWDSEPAVARVVDGIPAELDRYRCIGNAIVPQVAEIIGRAIVSAIA